MARTWITVDGNEAAASVAHRTNEVIAIYPITPSSTMGELADEWSAKGRTNIWNTVPSIVEMQSEAGVAGAVHGALQAGALATTFTASQGLLLMIPNLYKIAGELTPFTLHVTARTVATHALSIFGDHSDVMACRQTGMALLASDSVQEAHDFALIAQAATLRSRVPFMHFFDGFRTSHEVAKIEALGDADLKALLPDELIATHRRRALTPDAPTLRGTAQNPDVFFQAREACNPFYLACPGIVQGVMDALAARVGRQYHLFDYAGHPSPERVIVAMGSGAETARVTAEWLVAQGERVGVVTVRLYRPFAVEAFTAALPRTVTSIAVLDRTKEPGAVGEPLYQDVVAALAEARAAGLTVPSFAPRVIGGRYGLASKEFTPAMVKAVFDELARPAPRPHFTAGIVDDVTRQSLAVDEDFHLDGSERDVVRAVFFGLGADGTVGANKNSIKIIGEDTDNFAQGYFVYDSKKSGAVTISHLRFGPRRIKAPYLIRRASFVACHQYDFLDKYDVLELAEPGAVFLLNAPFEPDRVWDELSSEVQQQLAQKGLKFYVIDASAVARATNMGTRINTIMQTCFFAISGVLPREEAIRRIKEAIRKTYSKRGEHIVEANFAAVDHALANLHLVDMPAVATSKRRKPAVVSEAAPEFVQRVTAVMLANHGDQLPVSAFPPDGRWPMGTAKWEKRNIATDIPVWDEALCIQCNKCAMVCPHAAIRAKVYPADGLAGHPDTFKAVDFKAPASDEFRGLKYTIQVAPEDCTGCMLCSVVCPAKDKGNPKHKALDMHPQRPLREAERANYAFFLDLPEASRSAVKPDVKSVQFLEPLFEYSGACAGCGETPYIKLVTQLFGDRALIANATGCSSIYGANLPTTPYTTNRDGRGPGWANSLFEDNAEFGLGMRLAVDSHRDQARVLVRALAGRGLVGDDLAGALLDADQSSEAGLAAQRARVAALRSRLAGHDDDGEARRLSALADYLVTKSVWIIGGDGWAYDIGYGGLDHVLSLGRNVNILVLDTEVYSNTGGQQSKATPLGASAKFAAAGKATPKKDLGLMAMAYGNVYVARIAFGAKDAQTVKALTEAEAYAGTSLVIAYSHCIAHGYDLVFGLEQQKLAVESGHWPLFRFDPRRVAHGEPALQLDSGEPKVSLETYMRNESRYRMVEQAQPARFRTLVEAARADARERYALYVELAGHKAQK
ncbi:MAG TPA: pyruvate:ferredoxin (flavodoxin) oxidoreductase [Vicinamibacterales bacterium]|nr:pyruvate:ferredoxin (flavodoxin) oxidoreductase [Vicinamibacterales bacterium]